MSPAPTAHQPSESLSHLLRHAAFSALEDRGWIEVSGPDRVRWLNGMVTNNIAALVPGRGCYCFVLSAQGRIQADLHAFAEADVLLLESSRSRIPALIELLDRFLIMDEVELKDLTTAPENRLHSGLLVAGPEAAGLLSGLDLSVEDLAPLSFQDRSWHGESVRMLQAESPLVPRFELWSNAATVGKLQAALHEAGVAEAVPEAVEQLRLLEGTPRFGVDINDRDLPQETGQSVRALHFSKGCYLGQEIVERIHSRGKVHRTFSAFRLEGGLPETPAPLTARDAPEKPVGELTSAARIEPGGEPITLGLGYIRREVLERGETLLFAGGRAVPCSSPWQNDAASPRKSPAG